MILIAANSLSDLYSRLRPVADQAALRDASRVEAPAAAAGSDNASASIVKTSHGSSESTATAANDVAAYLSLGRRSARTGQTHVHLHAVGGPRLAVPLSSDPREAEYERIAQTSANYEARQQQALQDRIINGDSTASTDGSSNTNAGSTDTDAVDGSANDQSTTTSAAVQTVDFATAPASLRAVRAYTASSATSSSFSGSGHQLAIAA